MTDKNPAGARVLLNGLPHRLRQVQPHTRVRNPRAIPSKRLIHETLENDARVEVDSFSGLLVDYVRSRGAKFVIRGLRAVADFEYEFQFAHMNRQLAPEVETIFLMTNEDNFFVSSSLVREVAEMGGDIGRVVPPVVLAALKKKFNKLR